MALDITLILVFAFFYVRIAFNHGELADNMRKMAASFRGLGWAAPPPSMSAGF
jgi:preprotein translocase subunit SecY